MKGNVKSPPHYIGHRRRLKQKFIKQPNTFLDYELLELFLSYGSHVRTQNH